MMVASTVGPAAQPTPKSGGGDMGYPYNFGRYSRTVMTTAADTQRWLDRGPNWCFGYHHDEEAVAYCVVFAA